MQVNLDKIPASLKAVPNWVCWRYNSDGGVDKCPRKPDGSPAASNDPSTWSAFEACADVVRKGKMPGCGFILQSPFAGVDLDACRDKETGRVAEWAKLIIMDLDSYAEVSPSGTGVKVYVRGKSPCATGRNKKLPNAERMPGVTKEPGIELYDHSRFFAMTGWKLKGSYEVEERQNIIDGLAAEYFPDAEPASATGGEPSSWRSEEAVIERARKYLAALPPAVSGQNGHGATFHAACVLVLGFCLQLDTAYRLMCEYNARCQPEWSEKDLRRKVDEANKQAGERGYLRNAKPERWESIAIPDYSPRDVVKQETRRPDQQSTQRDEGRPRVIQIVDAMTMYLDSVASGASNLIGTSIGQLDYALGGGVARGEMVVVAARPSHGKSAIALQMLHHWTEQGMPCAFLSEEMSTISIGKRTLQYATPIHMEHWGHRQEDLRKAVERYRELHKPCYVVEQCGNVSRAMRELTELCKENAVEAIVVDYAQLLSSPGKSRYEQVTNTSIAVKTLASATNAVVVMLCQLNRAVESRDSFTPTNADIKDSGQIEQDADVILHLKWPYKIKDEGGSPKRRAAAPEKHGPNDYFVYVGKNRNRQINAERVDLFFDPARQTIREKKIEEQKNYVTDFAAWASKPLKEPDDFV